ncbi:hypothetical protein U1Q18_033950 [Sarracenia purpurea var. burkii]
MGLSSIWIRTDLGSDVGFFLDMDYGGGSASVIQWLQRFSMLGFDDDGGIEYGEQRVRCQGSVRAEGSVRT